MRYRSLVILFILLISLAPAFYVNRVLQKKINPRRSLGRLLAYMLSALFFVFIYTFLMVMLILHLFPVPMK
jgi:hypothetical protein